MSHSGLLGPNGDFAIVAWRLSGSHDFAGQWRDTTYLQRHAEMLLKFDNRAVHINYADSGEYVDAPLYGTATVVHGPHVADGFTYSVLFAGRREIIRVTKRNGKAITQGFLELSKDGKFITDSWWSPGEPAVKDIIVYEKK